MQSFEIAALNLSCKITHKQSKPPFYFACLPDILGGLTTAFIFSGSDRLADMGVRLDSRALT